MFARIDILKKPFSVRRGSHRSVMLETVQLLQNDSFEKTNGGKKRVGL